MQTGKTFKAGEKGLLLRSVPRTALVMAGLGALMVTMMWGGTALAEEAAEAASATAGTPMGQEGALGHYPVDFLWTVVAGILVFFMQAGFALVEAGMTRAKNTVNIMMKNLMDFAIGSLAFWFVGFGIMFGATTTHFFGTGGLMLSEVTSDGTVIADSSWTYAFLFFQTVFCATAATIVSGAMAERTKFTGYLVYSLVISALIYPVFGSWAWGGLFNGEGWLEGGGGILASMGFGDATFIDYAGSTVVHSVGGWAALAGAMVIGPRIGKFGKNGEARVIPGHSMSLAALGVFILWMGWFGFNAGSTTQVTDGGGAPFDGTGKAFALIAINTNLAASAGAIAGMFASWKGTGKPDIGMALNGTLAGLVGITAPCANVAPWAAVIIGAVAGGLVVASCKFFDNIKIDDPVGAISVHGVNGVWGTLAAALFNKGGFTVAQLGVQIVGVVACFAWTFSIAFVMFKVIKATVGLRVAKEDEIQGLDLSEHGSQAYPDDLVTGLGAPPEPTEA